nr:hypothetical protein [Tanacetum cinerariifolium]
MIMKGNDKNNETLIALTPILSVEDKRYEALQVTDTGCRLFPVGAPFTQGTIYSIPIGGNISLEGFLLPILMLVVNIVTVVIVAVILVVVFVAIVGVAIVVTIIGVVVVIVVIVAIVGVAIVVTIIGVVVVIGVFAIIKLSFVIIVLAHNYALLPDPLILGPGDLVGLLYSNRFVIGITPGQGILSESTSSEFHFAVLGIVATRKYRFSLFKPMNETNSSFLTIEVERLAAHKLLKISKSKTSRDGNGDNGMRDLIGGLVSLEMIIGIRLIRFLGSGGGVVDLTGNEDPIDEDGDTKVSDSEVSVSLGKIFSGGRKS